jgi:hypothetical protein
MVIRSPLIPFGSPLLLIPLPTVEVFIALIVRRSCNPLRDQVFLPTIDLPVRLIDEPFSLDRMAELSASLGSEPYLHLSNVIIRICFAATGYAISAFPGLVNAFVIDMAIV